MVQVLEKIAVNPRWSALLVFAVAFLLYANTLQHEFVWDDYLVIENNEYTQKGISGLKDIWTKQVYIQGRDIYRPVSHTFFALQWEFFGDNPHAFHWISVLLYGLCCIVLLKVLGQMHPENKLINFLAVLLFAAHPIHTEVVANIKSQDEMLSFLFGMGFVSFGIRTFSYKNLLLALLFLSLSVLSKVSGWLFVVMVVGWWVYVLLIQSGFKSLLNNIKHGIQQHAYIIGSSLIFLAIASSLLGYVYDDRLFGLSFFILLSFLLVFVFIKKDEYFLLRGLALFFFANGAFCYNQYFFQISIVLVFIIYYLSPSRINLVWFLTLLILSLIIGLFILKLGAFIPFIGLIGFFLPIKKGRYIFNVLIIAQLIITCIQPTLYFKLELAFTLLLFCFSLFDFFNVQVKRILLIALIGFWYLGTNMFFRDEGFYRIFQENVLVESFVTSPSKSVEKKVDFFEAQNVLAGSIKWGERIGTSFSVISKYFQLLVLPINLVHNYGIGQFERSQLSSFSSMIGLLLLLVMFTLLFFFIIKKNLILFLHFLFFISHLLFYSNLLFLLPDTLAERFLFVSSFSLPLVLLYSFRLLSLRFNKHSIVSIVTLVMLCIYISLSFSRSFDWKSNDTLVTATLKQNQNNATLNFQMANSLRTNLENGDIIGSEETILEIKNYYQRALSVYPGFYNANYYLGTLEMKYGSLDTAVVYLNAAKNIRPTSFGPYRELGYIMYQLKKYNEGISNFEKELLLNETLGEKERVDMNSFLARCYFNVDSTEKAYFILDSTAGESSGKTHLYVLKGNMQQMKGFKADALKSYETALNYNSKDSIAMGFVYKTAIELGRKDVLKRYFNL